MEDLEDYSRMIVYGSSWPSEDIESTPMEILDLPEDIRLEIDAIIERNDSLETQMGAFDMRLLADRSRSDPGNESGIGSDSDSGNIAIDSSSGQQLQTHSDAGRSTSSSVRPCNPVDDIDAFIAMMIVPPPPPQDFDTPPRISSTQPIQTYSFLNNSEAYETNPPFGCLELLHDDYSLTSYIAPGCPDVCSSDSMTSQNIHAFNNRSIVAVEDPPRVRYQKNTQNSLRNSTFGATATAPDVSFIARPYRSQVGDRTPGILPTCFEIDETEDPFLEQLIEKQQGISESVERKPDVRQTPFRGLNSNLGHYDVPVALHTRDSSAASKSLKSDPCFEKHNRVVYRQKDSDLTIESGASIPAFSVTSNQRNIYSTEAMSKVKSRPMSEIFSMSNHNESGVRRCNEITDDRSMKSRDDSDLPHLFNKKQDNKQTHFSTVVFRNKKGKNKIDMNSPRAQSMMALYDSSMTGSLQDLSHVKKSKQHASVYDSSDLGKMKKTDIFRSRLTSAKSQSLSSEQQQRVGELYEFGCNWEVQRSDYMTPVDINDGKSSTCSKHGNRQANVSLSNNRISAPLPIFMVDTAENDIGSQRISNTFNTFRGDIKPLRWVEEEQDSASLKPNNYNPYRGLSPTPVGASRRSVLFAPSGPGQTTTPSLSSKQRILSVPSLPQIPDSFMYTNPQPTVTSWKKEMKSTDVNQANALTDISVAVKPNVEKSLALERNQDTTDTTSVSTSYLSSSNASLERMEKGSLKSIDVASVVDLSTASSSSTEKCECTQAVDDMNVLIEWLKEVKEKQIGGTSSTTEYTGIDLSDDLSKRIRNFEFHKNALVSCSRQLVTNCKCMVRGATRSREEFEKCIDPCIGNITIMYDSCDSILKLISDAEARNGLIDSVLGVSEILCGTLVAANMTVADTKADIALEVLMQQATFLAEGLLKHMNLIKSLDFRILGSDDALITERL